MSYISNSKYSSIVLSGIDLHIQQFVPFWNDKEADAVHRSRQLNVIDQQGQKNHIREESGEINHLWHNQIKNNKIQIFSKKMKLIYKSGYLATKNFK